jgi:hypothetical protein
MSQERLNGLTILSIKQDLLEKIEYKSLISKFAAEIVCRVIFFFFFKIEGLILLYRLKPHNSYDRPGCVCTKCESNIIGI